MIRLAKSHRVGPAPAVMVAPGAKNSLLPGLYAAQLLEGTTLLSNAPVGLVDSLRTLSILRSIGSAVKVDGDRLFVSGGQANFDGLDQRAAAETRYSALLLGLAIAQGQSTRIPHPGGCRLRRGIDIHVAGLQALGAKVEEDAEGLTIRPGHGDLGAFHLRVPSVGATLNLILAAVIGEREITLSNVSCEPEVIDLVSMLNMAGAKLAWLGQRTLHISPATRLKAVAWTIIPDRIVAVTYMVAAAMLERGLLLKNVRAEHMESPLELLRRIGVPFEVHDRKGEIRLRATSLAKLRPFMIAAEPYPGFPTDLQPIMAALAARIWGESKIHEKVFDFRFQYVEMLNLLGSDILVEGDRAIISGNPTRRQSAAQYTCTDIRGGMACTLYAMSLHADAQIERFVEIERGYVNPAHAFSVFGYDLETATHPA